MDIKTLSDKKLDFQGRENHPTAFELFVILPWSDVDNVSFSWVFFLFVAACAAVKSLSCCLDVEDIFLQSSWGGFSSLLLLKLHSFSSCLLSPFKSGNKLHFWFLRRLIWELGCRRSTEFEELEFESSVEFVVDDRLFLLEVVYQTGILFIMLRFC